MNEPVSIMSLGYTSLKENLQLTLFQENLIIVLKTIYIKSNY